MPNKETRSTRELFFGKNTKYLRLKHGFSLQNLADETKVSTKTLSRWEKGDVKTKPHDNELKKVADVLGANTNDFLYKDLENQNEQRANEIEFWKSQGYTLTSFLARTDILLNYDLVLKEYGVSKEQLFNLAPLLFTVLAEQSLKWRREKLKLIEQKIEEIRLLGSKISRQVAFSAAIEIDEYNESINEEDIFNNLQDETLGYPYDNPFFEYINAISDPENIKIWNDLNVQCPDSVSKDAAMNDEVPSYKILPQALSKIFASTDFNKYYDENGEFDYSVFAKLTEIPQLKHKYHSEEKLKWATLKAKLVLTELRNDPAFRKEIDELFKEIRNE